MTKREFIEGYLKTNTSVVGSAIPITLNAEKEVTQEWLMCFVKNLIELLKEKTEWHTGTPTEEGLYVVLTKVTTIGIHSSEGAYILDWWDGYCFKNLEQMARHNPIFGNDVYSWVKWQKIEP